MALILNDMGREASMRPRLIAVDDAAGASIYCFTETASMRPRLIAVDDNAWRGTSSQYWDVLQ